MENFGFHIKHLRLNDAPQVRIMTQENAPGFPTYEEAISFCRKHGFSGSIFRTTETGIKLVIRL